MSAAEKFRGRTFMLGGLACPVAGVADDSVLVKVGHELIWLNAVDLEEPTCERCGEVCGACVRKEEQ